MRFSTRLLEGSAAAICGALMLATGVVPLAAAIGPCDASDEAIWKAAKETLGIFVVDDHRAIGGAVGAVKFTDEGLGYIGNKLLGGYYPVSGYKQIACGQLDFWNLYKLGSNELDLHPHLQLAGPYRSLIDDLPRGRAVCPGCLWGEVTVPRGPDGFEWFWKAAKNPHQPREGDNACSGASDVCGNKTLEISAGTFCMYGPWIMEKAHNFHPEIHPVQAFWGQAPAWASVYVVDDDSSRFEAAGRFSDVFLSRSPFAAWSGSLAATMFQVVRVTDGQRGWLEWRDNKSPLADVQLGEAQDLLTLKAPAWLTPRVTRVCASKGATQIVLQSPIVLSGKTRWRGIDIFGDHTGITYGRGSSGSNAKDTGQHDEDAPWDIRSVLEWSGLGTAGRDAVRASEREWGLEGMGVKWYPVNQRLVISAFSRKDDEARPEVPAGLKSTWTISAVDLGRGGRPMPLTTGMVISLDHDRSIPATVPDGVIENRTARRGEFALSFRPTGDALALNVKLTVSLQLSNAQHTHAESFTLYSLAPDFLEAVSGYSFKKENGAFPDSLGRVLTALVRNQGCAVTRAQFSADIDGIRPAPRDAVDTLMAAFDDRLRAGGIVRQAVAFELRDRTIDNAEFAELRGVLAKYAAVCRANLSPVRPAAARK